MFTTKEVIEKALVESGQDPLQQYSRRDLIRLTKKDDLSKRFLEETHDPIAEGDIILQTTFGNNEYAVRLRVQPVLI